MKINVKELIISIAIPIVIGIIGSLLGNSSQGFETVIKPPLSPPAIVFPIVWTILYTLMGISSYLIYQKDKNNKEGALTFYGAQLIFNMLWTFFFFNLKWYLFAFIWLLILIYLVAVMIKKFLSIDKTAAYLQIPYLVWLIFAGYLNFGIYLLN